MVTILPMTAPVQGELNLDGSNRGGLSAWHAEQQRQREELARSLGLPLGKQVEAWLRGGIRLRGQLRLEEAALLHAQSTHQNTRFEISGICFYYSELESCIVSS